MGCSSSTNVKNTGINVDICQSDDFALVVNDDSSTIASSEACSEVLRPSTTIECIICYTECIPEKSIELSECHHSFCVECAQSYVRTEIDEANHDGLIACPHKKNCGHHLLQNEVRNLIGEKEFQKMDKQLFEQAVNKDPSLYHCKTPDCSFVVAIERTSGIYVMNCPMCVTKQCKQCNHVVLVYSMNMHKEIHMIL